ncbi:type II toxin-antitoxin system VapC family toxin [Geitlerinema sp. P-1104]|uniref:type II toxin-antitoxin system VapC family toxin n=1 Tax=Geitlerinema sp. P-1104 TaxID=2546230 RepID=UPI00197D8A67|nr:type II toxin-antitoxin system VapC family toxin [Geitlerinema sp. P-1104]
MRGDGTRKNGYVPSIAIWEIALKVKRNKLDLGVKVEDYVAALKQSDVVTIVPIDEDIWLETVQLNWEHRDPADRVVVAIAQMTQSSIMTADTKIAKFYPSIIG